MFQFPSNGKVLSDKSIQPESNPGERRVFQFPSNGKVLSDLRFFTCKMLIRVSIPFQRESPFGRGTLWITHSPRICFNSLQTGKSFRTKSSRWRWLTAIKVSIPFKRESPFGLSETRQTASQYHSPMFQFPSNGKVLSDTQPSVMDNHWNI